MEILDEQTEKMVEALRQSIISATERLNSIDIQKALSDHNAMEELKKKMGIE